MRNTGNYIVDSDITKENIDRTNRNKYMNWRYEGELGNAAVLNSFVYDLYYAIDTILWDIYAKMRITKSAVTTADKSTLALLDYYDSLIEENMEDIINGDTPEYDDDDEDYEEKLKEMPDAEGIKDGIKDVIDDTDNEEQKKARDAARERAEAAKKAAEEAANKAKEASQRAEEAKKAAEEAAKKAEEALAAEKPSVEKVIETITSHSGLAGGIDDLIEKLTGTRPLSDKEEKTENGLMKAREDALEKAEEILKAGGSRDEALDAYTKTIDEALEKEGKELTDTNLTGIESRDWDRIIDAAEALEKQAEEQAKANAEASAAQQAAEEAQRDADKTADDLTQAEIDAQLAQQEAETYDPWAGCDTSCGVDCVCDSGCTPDCDCDCDCDCDGTPCDTPPCDCDTCSGGDWCDTCSGDGSCNDCCVGDGGCAHGDSTCDCCVNDCCVGDCDCGADGCDEIGCPTDFCFGGDE